MDKDEKQFQRGDQVAYIPDHANGDIHDDSVEFGFVTSGPNNNGDYYVRYWTKRSKPESPTLRTKLNSECSPVRLLKPFKFTTNENVNQALKVYC